MNWLTSDTHFGHAAIVTYCNRPFLDVHHMDTALVENWNRCVDAADTVWHLGDLAWGSTKGWPKLVAGLRGHINLVLGNHDKGLGTYERLGIAPHREPLIVDLDGHRYCLSHHPPWQLVYNQRLVLGTDFEAYLCGHVHERWFRAWFHDRPVVNVGVDVWDFEPVDSATVGDMVSGMEILNAMATQTSPLVCPENHVVLGRHSLGVGFRQDSKILTCQTCRDYQESQKNVQEKAKP